MDVWGNYHTRVSSQGETKRQAALTREQRYLLRKMKDNLSYQTVVIGDGTQELAIVNSDDMTEKYLYTLPNESVTIGTTMEWAETHWIVTDKDPGNEVYTRAKMKRCNYLVKWVDDSNIIHSQWCVLEDSTKYLTGELEDKYFMTTRGDTRMYMLIGRNADTAKFNRETRFIIDDALSPQKLVYQLTKPLKVGKLYEDEGVYSFILQETAATDDDNMELGVADFYKHFPKEYYVEPGKEESPDTGKKVWL